MVKIEIAVNNFSLACDKYSEFGATDTEPRGLFRNRMIKSIKEKKYVEPKGDNPWELYSDMSGNKRANKSLTTAYKKVVNTVLLSSYIDIQEISLKYGWDY